MSSLDSAVTLMHVDIVTMLVSEDLHFNMSGMLNVLLDNHVIVIESFHGFSFSCIELVLELSLVSDDSHSFTTTTKRCLEHDGEANFARLLEQELWAVLDTMVPIENGNTSRLHNALTLTLGAHLANGTSWGSNESQTFGFNKLDEISIL